MNFRRLFKLNRYFIVSYAYSFADGRKFYNNISHRLYGGKYINNLDMIFILKTKYTFNNVGEITIANIMEVSKADYNDWIKQ